MAFDAGMLRAVAFEIAAHCRGGKADKISQPTKDSVVLVLKTNGVQRRLLLAMGASTRVALTHTVQENPAVPPAFCMLLRKHLVGAKLSAVTQLGYERVLYLHFDAFDEMGYPTEKILIAEIMGKYANLILTDGNRKILATLRTVDFTTSRLRQVLPGMRYELPPPQVGKKEPLSETRAGFLSALAQSPPEMSAKCFLTGTYLGTAKETAAEIVFLAGGGEESPLSALSPDALWSAFSDICTLLRENRYTPSVAFRDDGRPLDFSYFTPRRYGNAARVQGYSDFAAALDAFYAERDRLEKTKSRAADLLQLLSSAEGRILRKIERQREELAAAAEGETYRLYGDLITANIYRLKRGMASFSAVDYTEEPPKSVEVPLDIRKAPAQNAQYMYKLYTKAKKARELLLPRIEGEEAELRYLAEVRLFLDNAESVSDLQELREELYRAGYAGRMKGYTPPKNEKRTPIVAYTSGGYKLLCGRNNLQNEYISFRMAEKEDIWFHVKGMPGSHVIMVTKGEEPPALDYTEAAAFAAFHSSARSMPTVAVDYTQVKNLKKPPASKPGYVIYHKNYSAYVTPKDRNEKTDG